MRAPIAALLVGAALAALAAAPPAARAPAPVPAPLATPAAAIPARPAPRAESAPVVTIEGARYVAGNDLARLLGATKFWRPEVRKLALRAGGHQLTLTVDDPFAVLDDRALWLGAPVRSRGGEVQVPVAILELLPRDPATPALALDPRGARVMALPRGVPARAAATGDTLARAPAGARPRLRVIVLDPGRGGEEPGVRADPLVEKDFTLALARLLRAELARRLPVEVVLTREDDRALTSEQRAEIANRARADLVLSLHFDGVPGTTRSGATAWCAPSSAPAGPVSPRAPVTLLPWREVALGDAPQGRAAAAAILAEMDRAGAGPVRLRERLLAPLLGVDAPGVVLDCAVLTAPADRARVEDPRGLGALAAAIADGVARWARGG